MKISSSWLKKKATCKRGIYKKYSCGLLSSVAYQIMYAAAHKKGYYFSQRVRSCPKQHGRWFDICSCSPKLCLYGCERVMHRAIALMATVSILNKSHDFEDQNSSNPPYGTVYRKTLSSYAYYQRFRALVFTHRCVYIPLFPGGSENTSQGSTSIQNLQFINLKAGMLYT